MLARHPISILRENFPFQLLRKLAKGWWKHPIQQESIVLLMLQNVGQMLFNHYTTWKLWEDNVTHCAQETSRTNCKLHGWALTSRVWEIGTQQNHGCAIEQEGDCWNLTLSTQDSLWSWWGICIIFFRVYLLDMWVEVAYSCTKVSSYPRIDDDFFKELKWFELDSRV